MVNLHKEWPGLDEMVISEKDWMNFDIIQALEEIKKQNMNI